MLQWLNQINKGIRVNSQVNATIINFPRLKRPALCMTFIYAESTAKCPTDHIKISVKFDENTVKIKGLINTRKQIDNHRAVLSSTSKF